MDAGYRNALPQRDAFDASAERIDHAHGLAAANGGQLGLVAVAATDGPKIMVVDGGEQGLDANLAGGGLGHGLLAQGQDFGGLAKGGVNRTAHGGCPYWASIDSRAWATASLLAGFWPVTRRPSTSTCTCQSGPLW